MATFQLHGSQLTVEGALGISDDDELHEWCGLLLATEPEHCVVDMAAVDEVSARCLGTLVAALSHQRTRGHDLTVIPSARLLQLLKMSSLDKIFDLAKPDKASNSKDAVLGPA